MRDRLNGYLRAIENGETEKYHDYRDVWAGRMPEKEYVKKWGKYLGSRRRLKHVH